MTGIRRFHPTNRMNQAVVHAGLVYTAGQVAPGARADVEEQTREILARIDALLDEAGSDRRHILTANVYLADIADFDAMNRAWDAWVTTDQMPVRTTVEARLTEPRFKVEIGVVAALAA